MVLNNSNQLPVPVHPVTLIVLLQVIKVYWSELFIFLSVYKSKTKVINLNKLETKPIRKL